MPEQSDFFDVGRQMYLAATLHREARGQMPTISAQQAFEMILDAFARGDRQTLAMLLSPQVLAGFNQAIDAREQAGETHSTRIVSVREPRIAEARLAGSMAQVTVRFSTTQINQTLDAEGRVVAGGAEEDNRAWVLVHQRRVVALSAPWKLSARSSEPRESTER